VRSRARSKPKKSDSSASAAPATGAALGVRRTSGDLFANAPLPDGTGKEIVTRMCTKCHGTAVFSQMRMDRKGWEDEVAAMVERGAEGTPQEVRAVIDYLAKMLAK